MRLPIVSVFVLLLSAGIAVPAAFAQGPKPERGNQPEELPASTPRSERDDLKAGGGVDKQIGVRFFDTGPLRIREQFLPGMGFLYLEPTSADVLNQGRWQVDLVGSATNTWVHSNAVRDTLEARTTRRPVTLEDLRAIDDANGPEGIFFADGELYRGSASLRVGLGDGLQLSVTVPMIQFDGGFGDDFIQEFHDTVGTGQTGRLGVPQDAYTVYVRSRDGTEVFRNEDPSAEIGDVTVSLKKRLLATSRWRMALEGSYKVSVADRDTLYSSGSDDFGGQLLLTKYFRRSCLHLSFGALRLGAAPGFGLEEQTVLNGSLAWERALGGNSSFLFQGTVSDSPFEELGLQGLDEASFLVHLGLKQGLGEHVVAFFALTENLVTYDSSVDFGLHAGLTHTF